tara:strand:- start:312 stop:1229 length:918 start_codon:yes stop_codon:yes gene_type:complete
MKIAIVGLGVQGKKRFNELHNDSIVTVDPNNKDADYSNLKDIPLRIYNAVFICTPDDLKYELILYSLKNKKHVLVEKPLLFKNIKKIKYLEFLAKKNKIILYTAYNHRFESSFIKMRKLLISKKLGKIYSCRMFYGNGTARLVKNSPWKNKGYGVIPDLGSHLLDTCNFWFGKNIGKFKKVSANKFENKVYDHAVIQNQKSKIRIELEMTLCMWKNNFTCDILAEKGSAHIESLSKWSASKFIWRKRILPSGIPKEKKLFFKKGDPTWKNEHLHFKSLIKKNKKTDLSNDIWLHSCLNNLINLSN